MAGSACDSIASAKALANWDDRGVSSKVLIILSKALSPE
jgi:hypothetical protein